MQFRFVCCHSANLWLCRVFRQDNRLVDIPFSMAMLKWMAGKPLETADVIDILPETGQTLLLIQVCVCVLSTCLCLCVSVVGEKAAGDR
jgi:hypothetical protein